MAAIGGDIKPIEKAKPSRARITAETRLGLFSGAYIGCNSIDEKTGPKDRAIMMHPKNPRPAFINPSSCNPLQNSKAFALQAFAFRSFEYFLPILFASKPLFYWLFLPLAP